MTIKGVPEGYELIRIGGVKHGDSVITADGKVYTVLSDICTEENLPVVRKIEPTLDLSSVQFRKGWIAQDKNGDTFWFPKKPARDDMEWYEEDCVNISFVVALKWRADLDWTQRIFEVK